MSKISTRLYNVMWRNGFWPDDMPTGKKYEIEACKRFHAFCVEIVPEKPAGVGYGQKRRPAEPRWHRLENFGKSSFKELCEVIGKDEHNQPMRCFGVMVPSELYLELKRQAEEGQIKP